MSIQYLLVTFSEQRGVLADGAMVGVTNHILMLPANEYQISLDGAGYSPASQDVPLDGTSVVKPLVVAFTTDGSGGTSGGLVAEMPSTAPRPESTVKKRAAKRKAKPQRAGKAPSKTAASKPNKPTTTKRKKNA